MKESCRWRLLQVGLEAIHCSTTHRGGSGMPMADDSFDLFPHSSSNEVEASCTCIMVDPIVKHHVKSTCFSRKVNPSPFVEGVTMRKDGINVQTTRL